MKKLKYNILIILLTAFACTYAQEYKPIEQATCYSDSDLRVIGALLVEAEYNSAIIEQQDSIISNQIQVINNYINLDALNDTMVKYLQSELIASRFSTAKLERRSKWLKPLIYISTSETILLLILIAL